MPVPGGVENRAAAAREAAGRRRKGTEHGGIGVGGGATKGVPRCGRMGLRAETKGKSKSRRGKSGDSATIMRARV